MECKFKQAAADGLAVVRIFGHGISPAYTLQRQAGQHHEATFRGLDKVLDAASRYTAAAGTCTCQHRGQHCHCCGGR